VSALVMLALSFGAASLAWTLCGLFAAASLRGRRREALDACAGLPPVSVLKPLCGADAELERCLESCFAQDHPDFELVFAVERADDPALAVVERLRARYPRVPTLVVVHRGGPALNPKVRNLMGALRHARHDRFVISDSNVLAPPHWLRELAALARDGDVGIVTNVFVGEGERSLGSVQLAGFVAPGALLPTLLGDVAVIGKSLLMSRRELAALGGLDKVRDLLAEDFVLGKMMQHAGRKVIVAPTVLRQPTAGVHWRAVLARHRRWAMLRWRVRPVAFALEPVTSPLALAPLFVAATGSLPLGVSLVFGLAVLRDAGGWWLLRGRERWWLPVLLAPLRDALALAAWFGAPLRRRVSWRGTELRLGAGTLLYATRTANDERVPQRRQQHR
jgi:ceramide glucosyltransferase